jgi:hypothetical protein
MANLTWGQSPYLLNIPTVSNVTTSATGAGSVATLQSQVNAILGMVDITNKKINANTISNFSTTPIQVVNSINFVAGTTGTNTSSISGNYCVKSGNIYISSMGAAVTCATGNLFCDGQVYSLGNVCPSDPTLKKEMTPYSSIELPTPIRFTWKDSGIKDIGFSAMDVKQCVPEAVSIHPNGTQMVDYAKLVVTAIAEIRDLKAKLAELEKRI